jgi:hypothetical protein
MSQLLKALALKLVTGRTVGGMFGLLTLLLVPVAAILKFIGLPLLAVLGLIGAPLFLVLGAIGLPVLFVMGIGVALLLMLGLVLMLGVVAVKIVLPIVLVVWFVRRLRRPNPPATYHAGDLKPDVL